LLATAAQSSELHRGVFLDAHGSRVTLHRGVLLATAAQGSSGKLHRGVYLLHRATD
jgi:hypothetical protein